MENKDSKLKTTVEAITELTKAVPIYQDVLQPTAKQVGKSLETVAKTVNIALAPIRGLVWGYEKLEEFVTKRVSQKLNGISPDNIITPDPNVVGPALESLRYTGNNDLLSELFANLIANAMDKETTKKAHPGFVEIIRNLTSDEALLIKQFEANIYEPIVDIKLKHKTGDKGEHNLLENFSVLGEEAGCTYLDLVPSYIDNLIRLGILSIPPNRHLVGKNAYDKLFETNRYKEVSRRYETEYTSVIQIKKYIELSRYGIQFRQACVEDKSRNNDGFIRA